MTQDPSRRYPATAENRIGRNCPNGHAARPPQVERVVELLAECEGKVVILGVGKSGIIGQKIAATMTSAGTAALYLHPSDALHGGLGIVQHDVVIVLSNSGETDEIVAMLPYLKNRQVAIVAIVGNVNSTLARRAERCSMRLSIRRRVL